MATAEPPLGALQGDYRGYGAAAELWRCKETTVLISGPAGTGKSRAVLEKLYACAVKYPGMRALLTRKTRESLSEAALFTFEEKVLPAGSPLANGSQRRMRQHYRLANTSEIIVAGLDKPEKLMSTEYDLIYVQEATECEERDIEMLTTRLRNNVMPYQQLLLDCNPDAPHHWLYQRCAAGRCRLLESRHDENPTVTPEYLATLDALTGVRYQRLRLGLWVAAEGQVYAEWDPAVHRVDEAQLREWGVLE
jgi:PBSX family phage terminase large subunit